MCVFAGVVFLFFFYLVLLGHSQTFWLYFFKMYFFSMSGLRVVTHHGKSCKTQSYF